MKAKFFCAVISLLVLSGVGTAQSGVEPTPTPVKVVVTDSIPPTRNLPAQSTVEATPTPVEVVVTDSTPVRSATVAPRISPSPTPLATRERLAGPAVNSESPTPVATGSNLAARSLSFGQIKSKIAEAKRLLQSRPLATALVEGTAPTDYVRVAFQDSKTNRIWPRARSTPSDTESCTPPPASPAAPDRSGCGSTPPGDGPPPFPKDGNDCGPPSPDTQFTVHSTRGPTGPGNARPPSATGRLVVPRCNNQPHKPASTGSVRTEPAA